MINKSSKLDYIRNLYTKLTIDSSPEKTMLDVMEGNHYTNMIYNFVYFCFDCTRIPVHPNKTRFSKFIYDFQFDLRYFTGKVSES